jgi:hypothetical protein
MHDGGPIAAAGRPPGGNCLRQLSVGRGARGLRASELHRGAGRIFKLETGQSPAHVSMRPAASLMPASFRFP